MQWLATGMEPRRLWPVGYLNLTDGLTVARTDSPVANGRLMDHLEMADRGRESRWWLDAMAAKWVVLREAADVPHNMESVRVTGGMRLLENHQALPVVILALEPPRPDIGPQTNGQVNKSVFDGNSCRVTLDAVQDGHAWVSLAPVGGWRWSLDGDRAELEQGPGIVRHIPVAEGRHELSGRYRPPGLAPAAATTLVAAFITALLVLAPKTRRRLGSRKTLWS